MADLNMEILRKETYLKTIENSVGTRLFNSAFVRYKDTGEVKDIFNDGEYSCAYFVSSLLFLGEMLKKPSATVKSLREDIDADKNWQKVDLNSTQAGDIVFYEKTKFDDGTENAHVGFVLNSNEAVSTDYKSKVVARHPLAVRPAEVAYRYVNF